MSKDKNKIPQNQPKPTDRNYSEKVNKGFGENKAQQDSLRKGSEIPPKKKDK